MPHTTLKVNGHDGPATFSGVLVSTLLEKAGITFDPLDDKEGPYRIVIPDEQRMARWVRQVKTLKIIGVQ